MKSNIPTRSELAIKLDESTKPLAEAGSIGYVWNSEAGHVVPVEQDPYAIPIGRGTIALYNDQETKQTGVSTVIFLGPGAQEATRLWELHVQSVSNNYTDPETGEEWEDEERFTAADNASDAFYGDLKQTIIDCFANPDKLDTLKL